MTFFLRTSVVISLVMLVNGLFPVSLQAQNPVGFDFLRTFVGARPSAMSGAFVSVPGDIHNLVYNPAGLAALSKRQATLTYLNHLLDFQSGFLAYAQPLSNGTFAAGLHFFDFGQFEGKDENNLDTGEFGANSVTFALAYSRTVIKNVSLGGSAKLIRFEIDNFSETAIAADLGVIFSIPSEKWNLGVAVFNLGTTTSAFIESKDKLPLNVQVGASKRLAHLPLLISGALVKFEDEGFDFRFGGEFSLTEQLFLRLGYNSVGQDQKVDTDKDRLAGVSLGLGLKVNKFDVDYSFSSFGEVGSLNRITLIGRF
ncbi:PorV/PorQ family protein [candidate division KSB1 bacterium]|nr:PorV/PorQ family protein [candidate division KSB1 bacterium]NIR70087.1 PorV/PorQ family protein [candidate division KSB1 bacterium]NIS27512.1 PorV/PorQ family protein [candidate division KSB1 bacterium]NIT74361.1 PorV/PorQ family protein [candidate division KSB1 bacterium]NIU28230.1 PorV/PorQ family protein [candidate division KSB1 bacterium]